MAHGSGSVPKLGQAVLGFLKRTLSGEALPAFLVQEYEVVHFGVQFLELLLHSLLGLQQLLDFVLDIHLEPMEIDPAL